MKRSSFKVETKQSLIQTAKEAGRNTKKAQKALAQKEENSCLNGKEMKDSKHRAAFPLEGKLSSISPKQQCFSQTVKPHEN